MQSMYLSGIDDQLSSIWIQDNSNTFQRYQKEATYLIWIHSHVQGNECGFSSIDIHSQYAYEQLVSHMIGCVVEINKNRMVAYDFYQLTKNGKKSVQQCKEGSNNLHESCSGFQHPSFYKSVKCDVDIVSDMDKSLHIIDARYDCADLSIVLDDESEVKIQCNLS